MNLKVWLERYRTPLLVGAVLVAIEMTIAAAFASGAPHGERWLGDTMIFPSDAAVYLSYIEQGAQGHLWLANLFATEAHALRIDPYWSSLGLIAKSGLAPLALFEASRWLMTVILAFAIFAAVRRDTKAQPAPGLITWIAVFGAGLGWLYTFWIYAFDVWRIDTPIAADIGSEFSVFPTLFCGSHMILSVALLITALRQAWTGLEEARMKTCLLAALTTGALVSFHPYFIPLFFVFWTIALIANRHRMTKRMLACGLVLGAATIPALCIYLPLYFDKTFKTHHLTVNFLPLAPGLSWLFTLAPFAFGLIWRWRRNSKLEPSEYWLVGWIAAALICLILPLPWKRKFLEGMGVALVLLSAPFFIRLRDWIAKPKGTWRRRTAAVLVVLGLGLGSFQLFASQIAWAKDPTKTVWFYRPTELFQAWDYIKRSSSRAVVATDDLYANIFTPAFTGRTVVVGHDHETPDFQHKLDEWRAGLTRGRVEDALPYLQAKAITHLILTKSETQDKLSSTLEAAGWRKAFERGSVTVLTAPGI